MEGTMAYAVHSQILPPQSLGWWGPSRPLKFPSASTAGHLKRRLRLRCVLKTTVGFLGPVNESRGDLQVFVSTVNHDKCLTGMKDSEKDDFPVSRRLTWCFFQERSEFLRASSVTFGGGEP